MAKVEIVGAGDGTTSITVASAKFPDKKDSIEVEVIDLAIDTKGLGGEVIVGTPKTEELVINRGTIPAGGEIVWSATYDSGWDNSFTLAPSEDKQTCVVTGVNAGGGGRVVVTVKYLGLEWSGSSRIAIKAEEPPPEKQPS